MKKRLSEWVTTGPIGRLVTFIVASQPVIWGPRDRVHLGIGVQLNNAHLNVMSGTITIGDDSLLAHGVMVLTGTHDPALRGAARRDTWPGSGRDIKIGRGVWVASGAIIIGPVEIGDHAVVAAGSVVRQNVAAGEIVAGIPARRIGSVSVD